MIPFQRIVQLSRFGLLIVLMVLLGWMPTGAFPLLPEVPTEKSSVWPVFRGNDAQTGVSRGSLPESLEILWTFSAKDSIESAVAVDDGVVYLPSMDENLYALELATGKEKWRYKSEKGGAFKAAPAIRDQAVYIGDDSGLFHCINRADGKNRWTFETGGEIASGANFAGDLILFGSYDETLYCLTSQGKEKWKVKTNGPVNGSPAIAEGKTFVAGCDSMVHVIDIASGKELSTIDLGSQAAATAAVVGDHLYVGTMGNEFQAIDWKQGKISWSFRSDRRERPQPFFASAAVLGDRLVVGSRDKRVWCLDLAKGTALWSFLTGNRVDSSPVIAGNRVIAGSLDGNLYILDLKNEGKELHKFKLDAPIGGSPVVVGGKILVGTQKGTLYCLGEKK